MTKLSKAGLQVYHQTPLENSNHTQFIVKIVQIECGKFEILKLRFLKAWFFETRGYGSKNLHNLRVPENIVSLEIEKKKQFHFLVGSCSFNFPYEILDIGFSCNFYLTKKLTFKDFLYLKSSLERK
jgi:hypothetical protein